jgi:hypothetical protein
MQYPPDWTFVPEEQEFSPGIYDYSVVTPPGSAVLGGFCPTDMIGNEPDVLACQTEGEVELKILVRKLKEGTTLNDFHEGLISKMENNPLGEIAGSREYIETNNIKVSGLDAIQSISRCCEGGLLESGQDNLKSKQMTVYVVNGTTGYEIFASTDDEKDFDTYLPTLLKMIDSVKIE